MATTPDNTGGPDTTISAAPDSTQSGALPTPDTALRVAAIVGVLFAGAIFGFFYAWVCSTMWGLDDIDPRTAITAMNGMNGSVRNFVFAPAFFGTAPVLGGVALFARARGQRAMARWFAIAAVVYLIGGVILTLAVNVPMNNDLADTIVPTDRASAQTIWTAYSARWQRWNVTRTIFSGVALILATIGAMSIRSTAWQGETRRP